jgi:hypothetical protein
VEDIQGVAEGKLGNLFFFLGVEEHILCVTISVLRKVALKFAQSNHFRHTPNKDRNRWKETVQSVYPQVRLRQPHDKRNPEQQVSVRIE